MDIVSIVVGIAVVIVPLIGKEWILPAFQMWLDHEKAADKLEKKADKLTAKAKKIRKNGGAVA